MKLEMKSDAIRWEQQTIPFGLTFLGLKFQPLSTDRIYKG